MPRDRARASPAGPRISSSTARVHGSGTGTIEAVQPGRDRGELLGVEVGVLAERDPWVVTDVVEADAVDVAVGPARQLVAQCRNRCESGAVRLVDADLRLVDDVDGVDGEHSDGGVQGAARLDRRPLPSAEREIDLAA